MTVLRRWQHKGDVASQVTARGTVRHRWECRGLRGTVGSAGAQVAAQATMYTNSRDRGASAWQCKGQHKGPFWDRWECRGLRGTVGSAGAQVCSAWYQSLSIGHDGRRPRCCRCSFFAG